MLLHMMELKGRFNSKMIKKAKFGDVYFDEMGGFDSVEKDRLTGVVSSGTSLQLGYCVTSFAVGRCAESPHLKGDKRLARAVDASGVCEAQR